MLVSKKISSTKKIILGIVLILIFLVIGYLLYGNFLATKWEAVVGQLPVKVFAVPQIKKEFNFNLTKKYPYNKLRQPPNLPVTPGVPGRDNPFLPVPFFPGATQ